MSAIGGVIDFKRGSVDFAALNTMRNALSLRGRKKSSAYLDIGVGMFYSCDGISDGEQPVLSERRGYKSTLVIDSHFLDAATVMEKYRAHGVEFLGMLSASFSLALYDAERRMLLLARDKNGKKPLFYSAKKGRVYFSSEAKGLLALEKNAVRINKEILSFHLTSVSSVYSAADIYSDISEVRAGECILFCEMGISRFFYRESSQRKTAVRALFKKDEKAIEAVVNTDCEQLRVSLSDALVAFDMPQFDMYMPMHCRLFFDMQSKGQSIFRFKDNIKRQNMGYANEREDRLSGFYGCLGVGVMTRTENAELDILELERESLCEMLKNNFFQIDGRGLELLRGIFGDVKMNYLLRIFDREQIKKEDTETVIRILGMLCQTVEWSYIRELDIRSNEKYAI